jgi:hypothetical protein
MQDFKASVTKHIEYDKLDDVEKNVVDHTIMQFFNAALKYYKISEQGKLVPEMINSYRPENVSNIQIHLQNLPEEAVPKPEEDYMRITYELDKKSLFHKESYNGLISVTNSRKASVGFVKKMGTRNMKADKESRERFVDFELKPDEDENLLYSVNHLRSILIVKEF